VKRFITITSLSCSLLFSAAGLLHAQDDNREHLDAIQLGNASRAQWALAMDDLADPELRPQNYN